jgi:uncharacterized protein with HEPN domain
MQFVVIGEALIRLRASDAVLYHSLPDADRTIAFRNVIAHGYDVIVDEIVWEIIHEKIPVLRAAVQRLFNT